MTAISLSLRGIALVPAPRRKIASRSVWPDARRCSTGTLAVGDPGASGGAGPTARSADLELESESARGLAHAISLGEQELFRAGICFRASGPSRGRAELRRGELVRRLRSLGFRIRVPVYEAADALGPPDLAGTEPRPPGYWHTPYPRGNIEYPAMRARRSRSV